MDKIEKFKEKQLVFILFCVQFTHVLDFVIIMPLGPKFMRYFSIGPREFSYVVSAYAISAAASGFISSFFMDKFDRKKALIFLYSGFLIGTFMCAFAINHYFLMITRALAGGFGGILGGLIFSILGDRIPEERRGAATGIVMSAFGVSSVLGIPFGLYLAETFNWHAPFILLSILTLIVLIMAINVLDPIRAHLREDQKGITFKKAFNQMIDLLSVDNHRRAFMLSTFVVLSGFLVIPFYGPYLVKNVGIKEIDLSYLYLVGGLFTLVTARMIGSWSDRAGKHKVFYIMGALSVIPILILTHLPPLALYWVFIPSTLFTVIMSGRFVPTMALVTSSVNPHQRGAFMSLNSTAQSLAMGFASYIAGQIIITDANGALVHYNWVGYLSSIVTLFCLYLASRIKVVS